MVLRSQVVLMETLVSPGGRTHKRIHTRNTHTHTYIHTHTNTCACTHTHMHTHTHTQPHTYYRSETPAHVLVVEMAKD